MYVQTPLISKILVPRFWSNNATNLPMIRKKTGKHLQLMMFIQNSYPLLRQLVMLFISDYLTSLNYHLREILGEYL